MSEILKRTFSVNKTQKNFSKVAWFYDYWGQLTETKAINKAVSMSGLGENHNILDVGTGTGQLFEKLLNENKKGLNYGIDLSPVMIAKAKGKFKSTVVRHFLSVGNTFDLPYKSKSFDYIFSSYVLDLLPEERFDSVLNEFLRVLKDRGTGILIAMKTGGKWYNKFWHTIAEYFPSLLTNCRPVELSDYLVSAGFAVTRKETVVQNTFPSEIIMVKKL